MSDDESPQFPDYIPDDLIPAAPENGTRAAIAELIRQGHLTTDEIAYQSGVGYAEVHRQIGSLRDGRNDGTGGRGRPSSGPTAPLPVLPVYRANTGRHEWTVATTPEELEAYLIYRARQMLTAITREERMISAVPMEMVPPRATRRLLRNLREELEERLAAA